MSSTPQKNQSSHFENPYSEPGETPQKQLDNVEQVSSHVLRERNRHSDIFNREGAPETTEEAEPEPSKHIRLNECNVQFIFNTGGWVRESQNFYKLI